MKKIPYVDTDNVELFPIRGPAGPGGQCPYLDLEPERTLNFLCPERRIRCRPWVCRPPPPAPRWRKRVGLAAYRPERPDRANVLEPVGLVPVALNTAM